VPYRPMALVVLGANHRTAPIEVRERLVFGRSEIPTVVAELVGTGMASECVLLSTCNRTEFYLSLANEARGITTVRRLLSDRAGIPAELIGGQLYVHRDRVAVGHLFRVSAGLDSMVLGEPQIQGQVKEAYQLSRETVSAAGPVVGTLLNRLFQSAAGIGGRVRSETGIGIGAASVSTAAVELAKKIFGSLRGRRALVVGAGEMTEVTLECLRGEGVVDPMVVNRTHERAVELATRWGGVALRYDTFESSLADVDIVICSTAAPHAVVTRSRLRSALPNGVARPLCIIDIALPRDVEPAVGDEPNVFLYNVDDLQQIVGDNLDRRRSELPHAEEIVAAGVADFWTWYTGLAVTPTIRDLRERTERMRQDETERLLRRLAHLAPEDQQAIDALTRSLLNKLLHSPTVRLRQAAGNGRGTAALDTIRYLFELDPAAADAAQRTSDLSEEDPASADEPIPTGGIPVAEPSDLSNPSTDPGA
jgi:glutamyl-tRNA reductase